MRTLKVYLHGASMGTPPKNNDHLRAKRGEVGGWSASATRRNINFLRSVVPDSLPVDDQGRSLVALAVTLTVRDCPASSDDWHAIRNAFIRRLKRLGLYRFHWVTEWQRRGVPHLHGAFWFVVEDFETFRTLNETIVSHWLAVAAPYGAGRRGQHITGISDAIGWFQYVAKHAARGVKHYQRSSDNIPEGWKKTGRMWGKGGDWVTREPVQVDLPDPVYFRLRRLVRAWRVADARASGIGFRIRTARQMLKHNNPDTSRLRGVSEWIPEADMMTLLHFAFGTR